MRGGARCDAQSEVQLLTIYYHSFSCFWNNNFNQIYEINKFRSTNNGRKQRIHLRSSSKNDMSRRNVEEELKNL